MSDEKYYENMLFNYESSHRTYYRDGDIKPVIKTVFKPKPTCHRIRPPPLKDLHTLSDWRDSIVPPFTLLHRQKDIVRTNPSDVQQPYEKVKDEGLENAIKTRPRLIITPALSMDNVPPEAREILMKEIYTTSAQRSNAIVCSPPSVKAPLPTTFAPANPITLPKLVEPYVSPEWRMESVQWDRRQLRAYCDPTREFHLARPVRCEVCTNTVAREAQMKLRQQMKMKNAQ